MGFLVLQFVCGVLLAGFFGLGGCFFPLFRRVGGMTFSCSVLFHLRCSDWGRQFSTFLVLFQNPVSMTGCCR